MSIDAIDIETFKGVIPPFTDLVVYEKDDSEHCLVLNGFDEVGQFDSEFKEPRYGFMYFGA